MKSAGRTLIGKWVALAEDKKTIVASSENLAELYEKVDSSTVTYTKILDPDQSYAFQV